MHVDSPIYAGIGVFGALTLLILICCAFFRLRRRDNPEQDPRRQPRYRVGYFNEPPNGQHELPIWHPQRLWQICFGCCARQDWPVNDGGNEAAAQPQLPPQGDIYRPDHQASQPIAIPGARTRSAVPENSSLQAQADRI